MDLPAPYRSATTDGAVILATPSTVDGVRHALQAAGTLAAWAAGRPGVEPLEGRGTAWRVSAPEAGTTGGGDSDAGAEAYWLVRHYRRGGAVAGPLLRDRYLAVGEPRPVHEIRVSHGARQRGVATPEVLAGVVYPAGPFYRADLATAFIPDSLTLADLLFGGVGRRRGAAGAGGRGGAAGAGDGAAAPEREAGCRTAGAVIRAVHDAGLVHRDLNLRNVLLQRRPQGFAGYVLDLDSARLVDRAGGVALRERRAMLRRFWRSAGKFERKTGRWLDDAELEAFEAGYARDR